MFPVTSNFCPGLIVPIPTLPPEVMRILSVLLNWKDMSPLPLLMLNWEEYAPITPRESLSEAEPNKTTAPEASPLILVLYVVPLRIVPATSSL